MDLTGELGAHVEFGSAASVLGQLREVYGLMIAELLAGAGVDFREEDPRALKVGNVLRSPALRRRLETRWAGWSRDGAACEDRETGLLIGEIREGSEMVSGERRDLDWTVRCLREGAPARLGQEVTRLLIGAMPAVHAAPEESEGRSAGALAQAMTIGEHYLGSLFIDLKEHLGAVSLIEPMALGASAPTAHGQVFDSASTARLPGVLAINTTRLVERLPLAEFIYHEMVHLRLFDLYRTAQVLAPTYVEERRVFPPWAVVPRWDEAGWSVDRALAGAHVYVHMVALRDRVMSVGGEDVLSAIEVDRWLSLPRIANADLRAAFLLEALQRADWALGPDGIRLVSWLSSCLAS